MGMRLLYSFVLKIKRNRSKIEELRCVKASEFYFNTKSQKVRMFHVKHSDFVVYVIRVKSATYPHIPAPRNGKSQRSFL